MCSMLLARCSTIAGISSDLSDLKQLPVVAPSLLRLTAFAPKWRTQFASIVHLLARDDDAAAESMIVGILEDSSISPSVTSPAVSPASESREQLEQLSFKESESGNKRKVSARQAVLPEYLSSNEASIRVGYHLLSSFMRWRMEEPKPVPREYGSIVSALLICAIGIIDTHVYMAQLALALINNASPCFAEAREWLISDANFDRYPKEVLSRCVPRGVCLASDVPMRLLDRWCELKGTSGPINETIRPSSELKTVVESLAEALENLAKERETMDQGPLTISDRVVPVVFTAIGVLSLLGSVGNASEVHELLAKHQLRDPLHQFALMLETELSTRFTKRLGTLNLR